jgi:FdhD protein
MKNSNLDAEPLHEVQVTKIQTDTDAQRPVTGNDKVAVEAPLTIDVEGVGTYTVLCSPSDRRAMTVGFIYSEGIINTIDDISMLQECLDSPDVIRVRSRDASSRASAAGRNLIITSSCGLCGSEKLEDKIAAMPKVGNNLRVTPKLIRSMSLALRDAQLIFKESGGTHAIGLFNDRGEVVSFAEDIGRHNALDKAIGKCLLLKLPTAGLGAVLSGRISLEMVSKCARAGIEMICAVSAPTSLALKAASQCGITVVAFVRETRATIYTHPERVVLDSRTV